MKKFFTENEAIEKGISWKFWGDPTIQVDEFVKSDDGYVCQVRALYHVTNSSGKPNTFVRTTVGQYNLTYSKSFKVKEIIDKRRELKDFRNDSTKTSNREKQFVDLILSGCEPEYACQTVFGVSKTPTSQKVKRLMSKPSVVKYMSENLKDAFKEVGVDDTWILRKIVNEVENETAKSSERLSAVMALAKLKGLEVGKKAKRADDNEDSFLSAEEKDMLRVG
jgi:hypothetical protein